MDIVDFRYSSQWEEKLLAAREQGRAVRVSGGSPDHGVKSEVKHRADAEKALQSLEDLREKDETVPADRVQELVDILENLLTRYDVDIDRELERQHVRLTSIFEYAGERARARHKRLQNEVNSNFGAQEVAATKMGNVANTIQSYALRRYHCNLELIWSNLQRVVQKDDKWLSALQEAKTQLDFMVACVWLTLLSAILWIIVLGFVEPSRLGFGLAAIGGPLLAYMWYRAAAEQYRSFADVAMTTLDVFRFDLLSELRLTIPADVEDERAVWESFDELSTYGENQNFRYQEPKAGESAGS